MVCLVSLHDLDIHIKSFTLIVMAILYRYPSNGHPRHPRHPRLPGHPEGVATFAASKKNDFFSAKSRSIKCIESISNQS